MALQLRANEEILSEVNLHWSAYLTAKIWAGFGALVELTMLIGLFVGDKNSAGSHVMGMLSSAIMFFGPFIYRWFQNKNKRYLVTNQRVYVETGILSKSQRDIPLEKINDLTMNQGLIQRMFGAGNVLIFTGNDKPTRINDIDNPDAFKTIISEQAERKTSKSA